MVFAAAAGEILPDVMHRASPFAMPIGGAAGVAAMLAVGRLEKTAGGPAALMAVVGIDIIIDGLALGLAFATGATAGLLLNVTLNLKILFLGLTVSNALGGTFKSRAAVVGLTASLVVLLPLDALIAEPIAILPPTVVTGFLAFGLIVLLYLVTEKLLVEAHETEDRP